MRICTCGGSLGSRGTHSYCSLCRAGPAAMGERWSWAKDEDQDQLGFNSSTHSFSQNFWGCKGSLEITQSKAGSPGGATGTLQVGLGCLQRGRLQALPEQLCRPHGQRFFLTLRWNFLCCSLLLLVLSLNRAWHLPDTLGDICMGWWDPLSALSSPD